MIRTIPSFALLLSLATLLINCGRNSKDDKTVPTPQATATPNPVSEPPRLQPARWLSFNYLKDSIVNIFRKFLLPFTFLTFLTGCLTLPDVSKVHLQKESVIGLAIQHPKGLNHTHVGTTIFNNNLKSYQADYDLQALFQAKLTEELKDRHGFQVRILEGGSVDFRKLHDLSTIELGEKSGWKASADKQTIWKDLQKDQRLDAVVAVTPAAEQITVMSACHQFGCSYWGTKYSGLFTRSFLGIDSYFAVAAVDISVLLKDDPADLFPYIRNKDVEVFKIMRNFEDPKAFDAMTDEEFQPIKAELNAIVSNLAKAIAQDLVKRREAGSVKNP